MLTDNLGDANNRGEQAATALEANLANLESKLDHILASFGVSVEDDEDSAAQATADKTDGEGKGPADEKKQGDA